MPAQSRPESCPRSQLVRFDYDRARGWQARIPTWVCGTAEARFFPDHRHGGERAAFIAAKCYRDERFAAAGVTGLIRPYRIRDKRNQSGVVGVSLARTLHKNGKVYYAWTVRWNDRGTPHKRRFSIGVLGYEEAFRQACAWWSRKTGAPLARGARAAAPREVGVAYADTRGQGRADSEGARGQGEGNGEKDEWANSRQSKSVGRCGRVPFPQVPQWCCCASRIDHCARIALTSQF